MRLIDTNTFELRSFAGAVPPYAILSHTWGAKEVTFEDFSDLPDLKIKVEFEKIRLTCKQALKDGLNYAWVDSCCINKDSSSELSEAINSMFRWYQSASICYAYIEDLDNVELPITESYLKGCRWLYRGWTLQELLAPKDVIFFGKQWADVGRRSELQVQEVLEKVTGIPRLVLTGETSLNQISVAERMRWAAQRETTREEDIAYCLMGIFDVNMPMLYGEGQKAFIRLQEEILKQTQTEDNSLFAWRSSQQSASEAPYRGLFALSPAEFTDANLKAFSADKASPTTVLSNGRVSLSCFNYQNEVLGLKCYRGNDISSVVGIKVIRTRRNHFLRCDPSVLVMKEHRSNFQDVIFEKFAEMEEPSFSEDIYQQNGIHFAELPEEIELVRVHPHIDHDFETTRTVPVIPAIKDKIAFELSVGDIGGEDRLPNIGWEAKGGIGIVRELGQDIHLLLVVCAKQVPGLDSYQYYFDLVAVPAAEIEDRFCHASRPSEESGQMEIRFGWSCIQVRGDHTRIDGHQMFTISLSIVKNQNLEQEVHMEESKLHHQREALNHPREVEARREEEEEAEQRARITERLKRRKNLVEFTATSLLFLALGISFIFIFIYTPIAEQDAIASGWLLALGIAFILGALLIFGVSWSEWKEQG